MQRELLDADDERMQLLARNVFQEQFTQLMIVVEQISSTQQHSHFMALSVIALFCDIIQISLFVREVMIHSRSAHID
jgi:hypothetical protein